MHIKKPYRTTYQWRGSALVKPVYGNDSRVQRVGEGLKAIKLYSSFRKLGEKTCRSDRVLWVPDRERTALMVCKIVLDEVSGDCGKGLLHLHYGFKFNKIPWEVSFTCSKRFFVVNGVLLWIDILTLVLGDKA